MRKILLIQILSLTTLLSFCQVKPVGFNEIKGLAKSAAYNDLLNRFKANDTTLTLNNYLVIYYGQAFRDDYKPNARHDSIRAFNMYMNRSIDSIDFRKVLNYTKMILNDFPLNIDQIYFTGIAYKKLGIRDSSKIWFYKYDKLIRSIMTTGDGKSEKTAFIVTKVSDEYSIINAFGFRVTGQSLTNKKMKYYDLMSVAQNNYGIDKLFFDINLFFGKRGD